MNGAFAVPKKGEELPGECRFIRFTLNMIPINSYLKLVATGLSTLSPASTWTSIHLPAGKVLLWSCDNQQGACHVHRLPEAWRPFMAIGKPVPGKLVGRPDLTEACVACAVIPMGWLLAVTLFQHLHRRLGLAPRPLGASFPDVLEWCTDRPLPVGVRGNWSSWVQSFLDDFDAPEVLPAEFAEAVQGTLSPLQAEQRAAYLRSGIQWAAGKANLCSSLFVRMGAEVNGSVGRVGVPCQKLFEYVYFMLWSLRLFVMRPKVSLMVCGRFCRAFEFRRPLPGTLNQVWFSGQQTRPQAFTSGMITELLLAACLMPLAFTDLRAGIDGRITASDACESGGGACVTTGVSFEAHLDPLVNPGRFPEVSGPRDLCIGLFDGLGGLRIALSRLPIRVVG